MRILNKVIIVEDGRVKRFSFKTDVEYEIDRSNSSRIVSRVASLTSELI